MNKWVFFLITLIIICFILPGSVIGKEIIKLGTLAPKESGWGKIFREQMNAELMEKSDGQLQFKFYFGVDERILIERMQNEQFDAVSLTGTGLGQILHETYVFQLPMLFSTYKELDYVRSELTPQFSEKFENKGYVLLGWGDLGFIRIFSKEPIRTMTHIKKTLFWVWDIDPIGKAFVAKAGGEPIKLPIQNVVDSLKTSNIKAVYTSPLACIALQWHTEINYMSEPRLAAGVGATIISKKRYDNLSDEHKHLLLKITKKFHKKLVGQIRKDNKKSIDVLKEQGIEVISFPHHEQRLWREMAREVQDQFVGEFYSEELLEEVRTYLSD